MCVGKVYDSEGNVGMRHCIRIVIIKLFKDNLHQLTANSSVDLCKHLHLYSHR